MDQLKEVEKIIEWFRLRSDYFHVHESHEHKDSEGRLLIKLLVIFEKNSHLPANSFQERLDNYVEVFRSEDIMKDYGELNALKNVQNYYKEYKIKIPKKKTSVIYKLKKLFTNW